MPDFKYMTKEDELIFLRFSNAVALDANEDDYRDYRAMRARVDYRENFTRYFPHEVGSIPGLPARAVTIELETGLPLRVA